MKQLSEELITNLRDRTLRNLAEAKKFAQLSVRQGNQRAKPNSWSVLECLEHLNYYGDFYLPEIEKRIAGSRYGSDLIFKSGLLGNYFAKSMLPDKSSRKMKTFKSMDPMDRTLDKNVIDRFIQQQHTLLDLLQRARQVSLSRTKTRISISRWIKLRLGDTFRVLVYHNERHVLQAEKVLKCATDPDSSIPETKGEGRSF